MVKMDNEHWALSKHSVYPSFSSNEIARNSKFKSVYLYNPQTVLPLLAFI